MHQPKLMQQQTISFHNQLHPTISFGGITHQITPESHLRASMFKTPKANSYSQPALPNNDNKATPKHADSEKSSAPKIQHRTFTLNTTHATSNRDVQTAVSNWLATSQDFEKPPAPAPVAEADPILPERHGREYWLRISADLDRRLRACSEGGKAPMKLVPSSGHANPDVDCAISDLRWSEIQKFEREKLTPWDQRNTNSRIAVPLSPITMSPPKNQEGERKNSIEASILEVKEKIEQIKQEPRMQEQLETAQENKANQTTKVPSKQFEIAKPKKTNDDAGKTKKTEGQPEVAETKNADDAATVRAKAKKLAADAMVRHKEEQERKKYVEGRAQDIHENLLQCRPFDMDAVRREFSEKEVRDIKTMVRALGFARMR